MIRCGFIKSFYCKTIMLSALEVVSLYHKLIGNTLLLHSPQNTAFIEWSRIGLEHIVFGR